MYNVSDAFKTAVKSLNPCYFFKMIITSASGSAVTVTDEDIIQGTVKLNEQVMEDNKYAPGSANASNFAVTLISNTVLSAIDFSTTTLAPQVGLQLPDDTVEYVPMGIFYPDDISAKDGLIALLATDAMLKFDVLFSKVKNITYPANGALDVLNKICAFCHVGTMISSMENSIGFTSKTTFKTCRDAIQQIAAINGCWAKINREGKLDFGYPGIYCNVDHPEVATYDASNRFDFTPSQKTYAITEVICKKSFFGQPYSKGTEDSSVYSITVDYSNNPLIEAAMSEDSNKAALDTAYNRLVNNWGNVAGYTSNWQGNPALEAGDIVINVDDGGNNYKCLVAKNVYNYCDSSEMSHEISTDSSSASVTEQIQNVTTIINEPTTKAATYAGLATYANNIYSIAMSDVTALTDGLAVAFKVAADCAAPSLKIGALDAKPILQDTGDALDTHVDGMYEVRYNITSGNFIG